MAENAKPDLRDQPADPGTDDLDAVADRLEASLQRIAERLEAGVPSAELARRLDGLIIRLRDALNRTTDQ